MNLAMDITCLILFWLSTFSLSIADQSFDVRRHLSTVTRYGVVKHVGFNSFEQSSIPQGCNPIHLNLVARHGARSPTKTRIEELDRLSSHLEELIRYAKEHNLSLQIVPSWLQGWISPWKGKKGGVLVSKGEEELYDLGVKTREKFPDLFKEEYDPDVYAINATHVHRASASAVAFGMGLFSEKGSLGPGRHRAFAVSTESRDNDTVLRFFKSCDKYNSSYKEDQIRDVTKLNNIVLNDITAALVSRYGLNFKREDTSSLWFLCKQEASLLDITDQACALFTPDEVALLEWIDDLEVFMLKGYGNSLNYRMGVPLLRDVFQSMEKAIVAQEEKHAPGTCEKARLRFAHAETVVPFVCLLGLFLESSEFQKIQKEEPLEIPSPHRSRNWQSSFLASFAANNMLVLYSCPYSSSRYFVQVLHNERPVPMPGCNSSDFCPFEVFKENIVRPHLKHNFRAICTM